MEKIRIQNRKVSLGLMVLLAIGILTGCSGIQKQTSEVGQVEDTTVEETTTELAHEKERAPDFLLKDMEGKEVTLTDYEGQYLMVNFWATWCQYCDEEMPDLMAFQEKHKDELTVLAINVGENEHTVQSYIEKKNLNLKVLMDTDNKVAEAFSVSAFPTTFLIDPAGNVIGFIPGKLSLKDMEGSFKYLKENSTVK